MHRGAWNEIDFFKNKDQVFIYTIVPFLQQVFKEANENIFM